MKRPVTKERHLDAALKRVPGQREALLLVDWLAEDDQLLKQEDPPLPGPGQQAALLLHHGESLLLEQLTLGCDLPLGHQTMDRNNKQRKASR